MRRSRVWTHQMRLASVENLAELSYHVAYAWVPARRGPWLRLQCAKCRRRTLPRQSIARPVIRNRTLTLNSVSRLDSARRCANRKQSQSVKISAHSINSLLNTFVNSFQQFSPASAHSITILSTSQLHLDRALTVAIQSYRLVAEVEARRCEANIVIEVSFYFFSRAGLGGIERVFGRAGWRNRSWLFEVVGRLDFCRWKGGVKISVGRWQRMEIRVISKYLGSRCLPEERPACWRTSPGPWYATKTKLNHLTYLSFLTKSHRLCNYLS